MTLARQRVVGVADPYRVGAYNAIIPTTHGHGTNISCIFSNSPQSIVGCGDSTHRCRRRRHERASRKHCSAHNNINEFSVTLARQRVVGVADPYRVGAYNAIMPITPRTRRKHSSHFLKFSAVHCRVRRLDAPLPPTAAQNASSKQSELNSMNIANAHSVPNFGLQIAALLYL